MIRRPPRSTRLPDTTLCRSRHGKARIGRVLMARGRDATDVALITSFGRHKLTKFTVITDEITTDRKSTRLNSSHANISYAVFCLKKKQHSLRLRLHCFPLLL